MAYTCVTSAKRYQTVLRGYEFYLPDYKQINSIKQLFEGCNRDTELAAMVTCNTVLST